MEPRSPLADRHEAFVRNENERRARAVEQAARGPSDVAARASQHAVLEWRAFGPDDATPDSIRHIVGSYGPFEPEYAALRRASGLLESHHRGTLVVTGRDRLDFLNRMLTQELRSLTAGRCRESFWLNRKGRIDADMLVVETGDRTLIDLDWVAAAGACEALRHFLFAEEAVIEDHSSSTVRLSLHGPRAGDALERAGCEGAAKLTPGEAIVGSIEGVAVTVARRDQCARPGFELFADAAQAPIIWEALAAASRPVGWDAYNTARIEGGTPLFRVDFGADSLPHETGVIATRVNFRKGCYLGQEIVARMESLGAPKQQVVAFRVQGDQGPIAGAQLRRPTEPMATPIGVVTSSAGSPLAGAILGFATVRSALAEAGTRLVAHAGGEAIEIEIVGPPRPFIDGEGAP